MFTKISAKSKDITNKAKKFLLIVCKVNTTTKQYKTPEMKIVRLFSLSKGSAFVLY